MKNVIQVWGATLSSLAALMADLNTFLVTLSTVLATAYTIYKFISDRRRGK